MQSGSQLNGEGQTYVSFDKLDTLSYSSVTASMEGGGLGVNMYDGSGNIVTLKLQNDIIAPSYEKTMEAFIKTVGDVGVKEISKDMYGKYGNGKIDKRKAKEFVKNYKNLSVEECRDKAYESFTSTFMKDTNGKKIFFDGLREQGYNAIIDENDKKFGKGFTESPMIVFDKQTDLKKSKSVTISDADAEYFRDMYFGGIDDRQYLKKFHGDTVDKWDKWAGTTERREF